MSGMSWESVGICRRGSWELCRRSPSVVTECDSLECCRGVAQTEEHYLGFIQPAVGGEGSFPFITLFDPYVIEAPAEVQSGEPLGFT